MTCPYNPNMKVCEFSTDCRRAIRKHGWTQARDMNDCHEAEHPNWTLLHARKKAEK